MSLSSGRRTVFAPSRPRAIAVVPRVGSDGPREEASHPDDVVGGGREGEDPLHEGAAAMAKLPEAADRLHPPEGLLDELPFTLTDRVARVPRRPSVDGAGAVPGRSVLGDVRRGSQVPQSGDTPALIVRLVTRDGDVEIAGPPLAPQERGVAFRVAIRVRHHRIHDQPGPVLHQDVAEVAQARFATAGFLV